MADIYKLVGEWLVEENHWEEEWEKYYTSPEQAKRAADEINGEPLCWIKKGDEMQAISDYGKARYFITTIKIED